MVCVVSVFVSEVFVVFWRCKYWSESKKICEVGGSGKCEVIEY